MCRNRSKSAENLIPRSYEVNCSAADGWIGADRCGNDQGIERDACVQRTLSVPYRISITKEQRKWGKPITPTRRTSGLQRRRARTAGRTSRQMRHAELGKEWQNTLGCKLIYVVDGRPACTEAANRSNSRMQARDREHCASGKG